MNGKKEFIKRTFICVLFVLLCYSAVYFIIGTRTNIHHNGNGINSVRNELRNTEETQQEETRVIDDTARAITRGKQAVDESTRTNKEIADVERADAEIIDECQSILRRVRERNKSEN